MTYTMLGERPATTSPSRTILTFDGAATSHAGVMIEAPDSQHYYWSRAWQANERLAAAELACGEGQEFETAADAIAWLRAAD